jgi:chromosome segregation ATPase
MDSRETLRAAIANRRRFEAELEKSREAVKDLKELILELAVVAEEADRELETVLDGSLAVTGTGAARQIRARRQDAEDDIGIYRATLQRLEAGLAARVGACERAKMRVTDAVALVQKLRGLRAEAARLGRGPPQIAHLIKVVASVGSPDSL